MDTQIPGKYCPRSTDSVMAEPRKEPFNEETFRHVYQYEAKREKNLSEIIGDEVKCSRETIPNLFPIVKWLPNYKMADLLPDFISGLTVAVMHIPQGMAYALLGGVPPVVGIYMALFPVFVYVIMGSSPHVSMGSFAVVSMMVGKSVSEHSGNGTDLTPIQVATVVCFGVGFWQLLLGFLRLGSLSVLLSKTLISGFTTGAAVHVFTSQVKSLFGLRISRYSGPLKIVYTYYEIFERIGESNYVAVLLSISVLAVLGSYNELAKPLLMKKFKRNIPIPVELIMIVIGTFVSTGFELHERYGLRIISEIPTGLPVPSVPPMHLLPEVLVDGLIISIVAIVVNLSMANIFAIKHGYRIDGNQEILASGFGNLFGSFFSCMPFAASLSRSLIQESVGARTQLCNVVSSSVLVLVLLFVAPFFEPLPYCVLAGIIVVALKGMFMQFRDLVQIMKCSKLDGFVWLSTFLSVVILDIDYGLGVGVAASIGTMVYRCQQPRISILGRIPGTQIYKDRKLYRKSASNDSMLIAKAIGGLHFANADIFRRKIIREMLDYQTKSIFLVQDTGKAVRGVHLIIDMSCVPFVDPSAAKALAGIIAELARLNAVCILCDLVPSVYDTLERCRFFDNFPVSNVFPTIHQAVEYVERFEPQNPSNRIVHTIA